MKDRKNSKKLAYILSYYSPNYVRTTVLVNALQQIDGVQLFQARNKRSGLIRYFETILKLIYIRFRFNPDVYVLGFRAHEIYIPVRLITAGKKLVYDHFLSVYDSSINERKILKEGSILAKCLYWYEYWMLYFSSTVLTDTDEHSELFSKLYNFPPSKFLSIPVGTDEALFNPDRINVLEKKNVQAGAPANDFSNKNSNGNKPDMDGVKGNKNEFVIFTYATMQALHGIPVIMEAMSIVKDLPVKLVFAGKDKNGIVTQLTERFHLSSLEHHEWIPFEELMKYVGRASLCLGGPFGATGQASRVVTGKTYQFIAAGKTTIVADTKPHKLFVDKHNSLKVKQGDAQALAQTIRWAYNNQGELYKIGLQGRKLFLEEFSYKNIENNLKNILYLH